VLLTAFAAASALSAFLYGLRSWPGTPRSQSAVFLVGTAAAIAIVAELPTLPGIAVAFLVAGCLQPVVLVTRTLSMRQRLPQYAHAAGYSVMYAVQGVGYSLSAIVAGVILDHASPTAAMLAGVLIGLVLIAVSMIAERHPVSTPPEHNGPVTATDRVSEPEAVT
jgi:predicted MFS family arabinose efflux permease